MFKKILFILIFSTRLLAADYTIVEETTNPLMSEKILAGLVAYNDDFFSKHHGGRDRDTFVIFAEDDSGEFIGGICGDILGTWAYVDYASVVVSQRGTGVGTDLFRRLEEYVKRKGAESIQLFTWEFQGVGFYEKLGYECIGVIPRWVDNRYDAYFYKKQL